MTHLLSTKKLNPHQKELLLNAGFAIVEMNFISIQPVEFELKEIPENLIFTSKNAVRVILKHPKLKKLQEKKSFAVGEKTSQFLRENGFRIATTANYGTALADQILAHDKNGSFLFFCGKRRNADLPDTLKRNKVALQEIEVYDTVFTPKKIDRTFDGVLFFSPSGIQSYCSKNELRHSVAFCIGTTTAFEAKKYTDNVVIANQPSIENVIVQAVKYFK